MSLELLNKNNNAEEIEEYQEIEEIEEIEEVIKSPEQKISDTASDLKKRILDLSNATSSFI
jgi:negative regulator of replication initiation